MPTTPVFSDTVNQQYFIESLGGSQHPVSYLDRFPDSVYNKSIDSILVKLAYALLGPTGVGLLRQQYLEARIQVEEAGLSTADLDSLYTSPFAFARLAEETYELDADASLLSSQQRAQIIASDAAFRNRAIDFLKGIRAGATTQGIGLVAKSGLNHSVDVIENYKALYDQYCDLPLGLTLMGSTTNLNEVIIIPRQEIPQNAVQTLVLTGEPQSGWFTLSMPLGPNYQTIQATTNNTSTVTVPDSSQLSPGTFLTIKNGSTYYYAAVGQILSATQVQTIYPLSGASPGQPYTIPATGTFPAFSGNAQTLPIAYNSSYPVIQNALAALPVVGVGNLQITGGPLPDQPIVLTFVGQLGDSGIPELQVNQSPDIVAGIGGPSAGSPLVSQLTDATNNPLTISSTVTVDQAGISIDQQESFILPANEHAMQVAVDQVRPVNTFVTTQSAQATTTRQPVNTTFAGQMYTEVLRYETGNSAVTWPSTDALHWIESGVEHEAPRPVGDLQSHYQGFHNIQSIMSYTEAALTDGNYVTPGAGSTPVWQTYWDTLIGLYSPAQVALYPFLGAYQDPLKQFSPINAQAASPDPLVITNNLGSGVINGIYPVDYLNLSGVAPLPSSQGFWASTQRAESGSVDYLEIDLGVAQPVNYIYLEATNKPYQISVAYDSVDQTPTRNFVPVTWMPPEIASSTTSLIYDSSVTNPWTTVELHFTNSLSSMIFTRYVRIGFQRVPGNSPFASASQPVPYSIEVRNLRVGRNISSPMDRSLALTANG